MFFAEKEVKQVKSLLDSGEDWFNEIAGEGRFKREAGKYSLLHFATHGKAEALQPELSTLLLHPDNGEDAYLYAFEISSMDLQARLAVLSTCQTGFGANVKGEGVMSLGRAFAFAGCHSPLVSHWEVDD